MKILEKEMKLKRMTAGKLADAVGVSKQTITNWTNKKFRPKVEHIEKLKALGFSDTACLEPSKEVEV
jgi:transcriptional regulator with XRE-family HTH domain